MDAKNKVTIYIKLLNEGTDTARRTEALLLPDGTYRVLATSDYDPDDEEWEFLPGSIVKCRIEKWREELLIAYELVQTP